MLASIELFRSIESFIASFSFQSVDHDTSGKEIQKLSLSPWKRPLEIIYDLWANARDENIDCAYEALDGKKIYLSGVSQTFF
ncbi:unnamed protein product [Microthlaspi erraticum]|uniref:Uncharacterized protein n=1 Tax=Microthlaspi erraticum TaxID=1685480 RepID=A0A6D2K2K4_9BRAS|nr:unnamed protein product [Microthlaspi erraticum]